MIWYELSKAGDVARSHHVGGGLLRVVAGEQASAGWSATGRGVGLSESQARRGKTVEIGCIDISAVAAGVGEAHVVGQD